MDEKILRLKRWEKGIPDYPLKIEFWPTQKCNLNCKYCRGPNLQNTYSVELSDSRILKLIDESSSMGVKEWIIAGGGEPLIRKQVINSMVQKIKDYGMYGALTTNGTLFDKKMIKRIIDLKWDSIFFSIDGHDAKTNDFLRKKGAFKRAYKNLKLFQKLKREQCSKPLIGFSSVLANTNYKRIKDLLLLAYDIGCEHVIINPIKGNNTGYNEKLKLNPSQIKDLREQVPDLIKLSENLKIKTTLPILNTDLVEKSSDITKKGSRKISLLRRAFKHVKCYEPWTGMLINPEGGTGPCCERPEDLFNVSVKEGSLKEIWFSDYFQNMRKNILNNLLDEKCFICNAWKLTDTESIKKNMHLRPYQLYFKKS